MSRPQQRAPIASASRAAPGLTRQAWPSRVLLLGIVAGAAIAVQAGLGLVSDVNARRDAGTVAMDEVVRGLLGAVLVVLGAWVGVCCVASIAGAAIARLRGSMRVPRVPGIPTFLRDLSGRALRVGAVVVLAAGPSTAGAFEDTTAVVPPTMVVVGAPPPATVSNIAATVPNSTAASPVSTSDTSSKTSPNSTSPGPISSGVTARPQRPTSVSSLPGTSNPSPTVSPGPAATIGSALPPAAPNVGDRTPGTSASETTTTPRAPDAPRSHVVRTGEHFWSIAEDAVRGALGQEPSEAQTRRYWQRLIRANRARLADPGDEDLIIPGQVLELPPVR